MYRKGFLFAALIFNINVSFSQKLPNKQEISLRAPNIVKIDGKFTEWGGKFQAYNNATGIFYSIANDDEYLYFVAEAIDPDIINYKILGGGITISIQKYGKNNDKDKISVNYPALDKRQLIFKLKPSKGEKADTSSIVLDSVAKRNNHILDQRCTSIAVAGIQGIDTISVFNDNGIKATGKFDKKKAYTLELAISLNLLKLSANKMSNFSYHITLNGSKIVGDIQIGSPKVGASQTEIDIAQMFSDAAKVYIGRVSASTDFWGEYTLAKKP